MTLGRAAVGAARSTIPVAAAIGAGAAVVVVTQAGGGALMPLLVAILALCCFVPSGALRVPVHELPLGPVYAFFVFLTIGVGILQWTSGPPAFAIGGLDGAAIAEASIILILGVCCFWLGYLPLGTAESGAERAKVVPPRPAGVSLLILFATGLAAQAYLLQTGSYGFAAQVALREATATTQLITGVSYCANIALIVMGMYAFGLGSRRHLWWMAVALPLHLVMGSLTGFKGNVIWPIVMVSLVYLYYRRRPPWLMLGVLVLVSTIVIPANLSLRSSISLDIGTTSESGLPAQLEEVRGSAERALRTPLADRLSVVFDWASGRVRNIDYLATIIQMTPDPIPFAGGERYLQAPLVLFVPRVLWSSKPVLNAGQEFAHEYIGYPPTSSTSLPVTQFGDLYMNFGRPGVLAGMTLWGALCALIYRWFRRRDSASAFVVYLLVLMVVTRIEGDLVAVVADAIRQAFVGLIATWVLFGRGGAIAGTTVEASSD